LSSSWLNSVEFQSFSKEVLFSYFILFHNLLGQYRKETVNAPVLDQGVAYFDEKITIPTVFYYDEVKRTFLEKEVMEYGIINF